MDDLKLLVDQAKQGDKNAFARIYIQFYDAIRRYLNINLRKKEEAEDLAQNVFIKAWKSLPKFQWQHEKSLQAFLYRIAKNSLIDFSRKKPAVNLEDIPEIPKEENLLENIEEEENKTTVQKLLFQLTDWERQLITWRFWDELSYQQISKRTNQNAEALRVALFRILKKLQKSNKNKPNGTN